MAVGRTCGCFGKEFDGENKKRDVQSFQPMFSQPNPSTPGYAASHSDVFRTPLSTTLHIQVETINTMIPLCNNIAIG